ncbi:hypothetical protein GCM10010393_41870 [Streptomyces gobitricini]|uniref:HTH lacI-type domain-containing protein n=1 Tax=Streptomyces gobitricini TaxID=68211 RepID=A0ABN3MMQ3_9ACTN
MGKQRPGAGPTLEEVAALAGVGRGTVSRVINNAAGVKESTRRVVQHAIAELGYVPNLAARSLAGRRTDAIALVMTEPDWRKFAEPFFSETIRSVGEALTDTTMQLLLTQVRTNQERKRFVEYARGGRVDGVLLMSVHANDPLPDMLADAGVPTVMLGRRSADESITYVDADNAGGARSAVTHLLNSGRSAVATITGPLDMYVAQCRLRGYREALGRAGPGDRRRVRRIGQHGRRSAERPARGGSPSTAGRRRGRIRRLPPGAAYGAHIDDSAPTAPGDRPGHGAATSRGDGGFRDGLAACQPAHTIGAPRLRLTRSPHFTTRGACRPRPAGPVSAPALTLCVDLMSHSSGWPLTDAVRERSQRPGRGAPDCGDDEQALRSTALPWPYLNVTDFVTSAVSCGSNPPVASSGSVRDRARGWSVVPALAPYRAVPSPA